MMRARVLLSTMLAISLLIPLLACAAPATPTAVAPTAGAAEATPAPTVLTEATEVPTAASQVELEVAIESAGYGIELYEEIVRDFEAAHPGVTVKLLGVPEVWTQLQPRFVAGDTPDLVAAISKIDHGALIAEGQIMPLNNVLESPAYDQPDKKFIDTVLPGMLTGGKRDGHYYLFPWNAITYGVFYNEQLFEDNGWEVPQTWTELYALCEQIKAMGVTPIAFPGVWPEYFTMTAWWDLIERIGGRQAQLDMENLDPGAWNSEAVVRANELLQELAKRGYFQEGWQGQDHTVAQTLFVTGKAALNFNGTWLEAEMRDTTPEDFRMGFFPTPGVEGGLGNASNLRVGSDWWFIPAKAKQPELAGEFLKFVFSLENARKFVEATHSLSPIVGSTEGVEITEPLRQTMRAMEQAELLRPWYWQVNYGSMYDLLASEVMGQLLRQEITPQEMADRLEAQAETLRNDSSIVKPVITE